jgi:hypothetical protein
MLSGTVDEDFKKGGIRHLNNDTGSAVVGSVRYALVHQELLPQNPRHPAIIRQLVFKPPCQFSGTAIRSLGVGIIKA